MRDGENNVFNSTLIIQLYPAEEEARPHVPSDPWSQICDDSSSNDCIFHYWKHSREWHNMVQMTSTRPIHSAAGIHGYIQREKWIISKTLTFHFIWTMNPCCAIQFDCQIIFCAQTQKLQTQNVMGTFLKQFQYRQYLDLFWKVTPEDYYQKNSQLAQWKHLPEEVPDELGNTMEPQPHMWTHPVPNEVKTTLKPIFYILHAAACT